MNWKKFFISDSKSLTLFFDRNGIPIVYTEGTDVLYTIEGEPVAYLYDDLVFDFNGSIKAWLIDGWIVDMSGHCVLFSPSAKGGPIKPPTKIIPVRKIRDLHPIKRPVVQKPPRPLVYPSWSSQIVNIF